MIVVHLIRKPLADPTVAQNAMRFGTGGLNIDACRLPLTGMSSATTPGSGLIGTGRTYGIARDEINQKQAARAVFATQKDRMSVGISPRYDPSGRWPGNVVLQHLGGCRCEGVRQVRGTAPQGRGMNWADTCGYDGGLGSAGKVHAGYSDATGMETVDDWQCASGCPAADLDGQSGIVSYGNHPGGYSYAKNYKVEGFIKSCVPQAPSNYGDRGGASRFFKQIRRDP